MDVIQLHTQEYFNGRRWMFAGTAQKSEAGWRVHAIADRCDTMNAKLPLDSDPIKLLTEWQASAKKHVLTLNHYK